MYDISWWLRWLDHLLTNLLNSFSTSWIESRHLYHIWLDPLSFELVTMKRRQTEHKNQIHATPIHVVIGFVSFYLWPSSSAEQCHTVWMTCGITICTVLENYLAPNARTASDGKSESQRGYVRTQAPQVGHSRTTTMSFKWQVHQVMNEEGNTLSLFRLVYIYFNLIYKSSSFSIFVWN